MTTLLRVDASLRVEGSVSRALADSAHAAWEAEHPDTTVVRRDLGLEPLPADVWPAAATAMLAGGVDLTPKQRAAQALSTSLADELIAADAALIAVPLYNWGIPQHVKTWIDMLLADQRLGVGGSYPLAGRPAIITVARGGGYGPGTPKEGWDHATPYLERIFGDHFKMDVRLAVAELTLAPVTPAMSDLIDLAKQAEEAAHVTAGKHGIEVARQVVRTTV